jgi:bifunctional non-homologous end joining protein LigD
MAAEPLAEYHRKRDFAATPEPAGGTKPAQAAGHAGEGRPLTFVIHKHAARALHYDLRLEVGGVYASWAIPKGPSLDTHDKHLAVHVEDHPLEYGSFEGIIPAGEYGGGTVMIWDRGTFTPVGDAAAGIAKGDFKFVLDGAKLHGQWVLVRMRPRPGDKRENWLLIKEKDEYVRPHDSYDILAAEPDSAATGRTMDQIAAAGETLDADPPEGRGRGAGTRSAQGSDDGRALRSRPVSALRSAGTGAAPFPVDAPFQLATLVTEAPAGDEWVHEVKYDGYRLHIAVQDGAARVLTRNGLDWSDRFPTLIAAAQKLPATSALLDGEAVVLDAEGRSDFGLLQEALSTGDADGVRFETFDLLYLNGYDLRPETLLRRKDVLASLLTAAPAAGPLRTVEHFVGAGPEHHAASCRLLLEGSMSKRGDRPWVPGRTHDWLKVKCLARQEFVIGGWTDPEGARKGFGALLLGVRDADGALRYAGRVGTGFTERTLAQLTERLAPLATDEPPFADPPKAPHQHWVRPELVAEVVFREWTREGLLRQPSFKGLREDKKPEDVVRESPAAPGVDPGTDDPPTPAGDPPATAAEPLVVRGVTISNPERVLEPAGISKADLARYYDSVAEWMLPHVLNRPLTIVRCPHGAGKDARCFYQKHPESRGWPKVFGTVEVQDSGGPATYVFVKDAEGLVALAQLGTLEIHTWGSLAKDPEHPDRIIFDLDPGPDVAFAQVADGARTVRDALGALGLTSFVKTTGGHGLHVVAPITPHHTYDEVRMFAHGFVALLAREAPDRFTDLMAKDKRPGIVFIDYLRNAHGATAVAAYSTRARAGAHVSAPLTWEQLAAGADPADYDIHSVPRRLAALKTDPWAGYDGARTQLTDEMFAAVGSPPLP